MPKIDTKPFEELLKSTTAFENLIDPTAIEKLAAAVTPTETTATGVRESGVSGQVPLQPQIVIGAAAFVVATVVHAQLLMMIEWTTQQLIQSTIALWTLKWQLENLSPLGDLIVTLILMAIAAQLAKSDQEEDVPRKV